MNKNDIGKTDKINSFEEAAAIFAANDTEISKSLIRLMSPLLNGKQTLEEHRISLKSQLSGIKE